MGEGGAREDALDHLSDASRLDHTVSKVLLVRTGRANALGESLRAATWERLLTTVGVEVADVVAYASRWRLPPARAVVDVVRGRAVPELLALDAPAVLSAIERHRPDVCIAMTSRTYAPHLADVPWVLDFVDHLSENYRSRATATRHLRGVLLRGLGPAHERFERGMRGREVVTIAAGYADAQALRARWIPNLPPHIERQVESAHEPTHDLLFFGNLSYEPNVDAVERLGQMWPDIQRRRPGTTLLLGGRFPTRGVVDLARRSGWTLMPDFESVADLCSMARVGVAPLAVATGIQNKVLEAAAHGLPQVISVEASRGFGPHVPARVAALDHFADAALELLASKESAAEVALDARAVLDAHFDVREWATTALELISGA